jgi:aspartate/methionine/tyrosine aminotransferase
LERLLAGGVKAVVLNFPHNPTGAQPDPAEWEQIVRLVERSGAWLISDEMYRGLEKPGTGLSSSIDLMEKTIAIAGLSKAYGLAGLRCGWLVCRDHGVVEAAQAYKDYTTICSSAPSEWLALIAMKQAGRLRERCRGILERNRPLLEGFAQRNQRHIAMLWPDAGPVCFSRLVHGGAGAFCERLAAEAGVMLLPSSVYEAGDAHVRLGFGRLSFGDAIGRLEEYLSAIE